MTISRRCNKLLSSAGCCSAVDDGRDTTAYSTGRFGSKDDQGEVPVHSPRVNSGTDLRSERRAISSGKAFGPKATDLLAVAASAMLGFALGLAGPVGAQGARDYSSAQMTHDQQSLRGFHGGQTRIRRSFRSDVEARAVLGRILSAAGLAGMEDRIVLRASAETSNAEATVEGDQRLIFYNVDFMQRLREQTHDYWSTVAILAHEIGHHIRLHTIIPGRNHEFELEADYQAGFILRRMGATREQAIGAYRVFPEAETASHPGRSQRIQSVTLGWIDGGATHGLANITPGAAFPQPPAQPPLAPQQPQFPVAPKVSAYDTPNRPARSPSYANQGYCQGAEIEVSGAGKRCFDPGDPNNRTFEDCFWSQGRRTCGPRMAVVPSGRFLMGSSEAEIQALIQLYPKTKAEWFKREGPEHEVTIHRPFAVSEAHVTRGQFAAFVTATGHKMDGGCLIWDKTEFKPNPDRNWRYPGFDQDDGHPVVCVNWADAVAYTTWLSKETSASYRLITEAEAEYVIRGTSTPARQPRYFFGSETKDLCQYANVADRVAAAKYNWDINAVAPCNDGYAATAPGGQYPANAFGIRDAHGNAGSITQDCFTENYGAAPRDGSAVTHGNCEFRMIRGGSWNFSPEYIRSSYRDWLKAGLRIEKVGFRVVRKFSP